MFGFESKKKSTTKINSEEAIAAYVKTACKLAPEMFNKTFETKQIDDEEAKNQNILRAAMNQLNFACGVTDLESVYKRYEQVVKMLHTTRTAELASEKARNVSESLDGLPNEAQTKVLKDAVAASIESEKARLALINVKEEAEYEKAFEETFKKISNDIELLQTVAGVYKTGRGPFPELDKKFVKILEEQIVNLQI